MSFNSFPFRFCPEEDVCFTKLSQVAGIRRPCRGTSSNVLNKAEVFKLVLGKEMIGD